ncbi:MAG: hypothetical protein KHW55_08210, partial [Actinomyces sp.]|nr:hypothetical protein [Actinomyces sp.]
MDHREGFHSICLRRLGDDELTAANVGVREAPAPASSMTTRDQCAPTRRDRRNKPGYTLDNPEEYLSKESVERRSRQGISVSESDLP